MHNAQVKENPQAITIEEFILKFEEHLALQCAKYIVNNNVRCTILSQTSTYSIRNIVSEDKCKST